MPCIDRNQYSPNGGEFAILWTTICFGIHANKTLPQVMLHDPDWFFWAYKEGWFACNPALAREAELINVRARSIKLPDKYKDCVVKYFTNNRNKFYEFMIFPRQEADYAVKQSDLIDMSVSHELAPYDKGGYKRFLATMKSYIFGNKSARITMQRAEAFFNDPSKFSLLPSYKARHNGPN